jgi:hypothetical protein
VSADPNCEGLVSAAQVDFGSYDPDGDPITLSLEPAGPYSLGGTTVTLTVEDDRGGVDQCTATITVVDDTPPVITVIGTPITLWPPNHFYAPFGLDDFVLSVSDNCATLVIEDVVISKATSDEPENAIGEGDGNTTEDIIISADCKSLQLRKERQGAGNGRVYTVFLELDDGNGNFGTATCQVEVPHDELGMAIDDGVAYEVLGDCDNKSFRISGIDEPVSNLSSYPNPFRRETTVVFSVEKTCKTTIKVYNSTGQEVAVLFDEVAESGKDYKLIFEGEGLPQGIYFCRLQQAELNFTNHMVLIR